MCQANGSKQKAQTLPSRWSPLVTCIENNSAPRRSYRESMGGGAASLCVRSFCHTRDADRHIIFSIWSYPHINRVHGPINPIFQIEKQKCPN